MVLRLWPPSLAVAFAATAILTASVASKSIEGTLSMDESNFDDTVRKHERVLVQWYTTWCEKCVKLWPELTDASKRLSSFGLQTKLATVDVGVEKGLAGKYGIAGPQLNYYVGGESLEEWKETKLQELKTADAIFTFLRSREQPDVAELGTSPGVDGAVAGVFGALEANTFALVARVKKKSVRHKAFLKALGLITDLLHGRIKFAVVWLPKSDDAKKDATLTMRREGFTLPDVDEVVFSGSWSAIDIASWAKKNAFPLLGTSYSTMYDPRVMLDLGWEGSVVLCSKSDGDIVGKWAALVKPLAAKHHRWKFALCDLDALEEADKEALLGSTYRQEGDDEPFVSFRLGSKKRYVLGGAVHMQDTESVAKFLSAAAAGKIPGRYKSEPPLANDVDEKGVVLLKGSTFDQHVKDPNKDVFVAFTHPRCTHCEQLSPVWARFAGEVKSKRWGEKGVVVAKMDMEHNECEEDITQYPKLVLYPAVRPERTMREKKVFSPTSVEKLSDLPIAKLVDFLLSTAVNLEGEEEKALEAELAGKKARRKRQRAQREL
mmetsp:Transcript_73136/g.202832  ORF Transcript_73136/g.202832 Transcript_73136/m.202832 type:complete len:547 (-) Transcript_73136:69-1709(-)